MAADYVRALPFVRQATIPEAGHFCFLEARAAFNALLRNFFATTEAGAR